MQTRIIISGLVQDIGFRYFVLDNAIELGITGWVRNTKDGKVEAVLQGRKEDIQKLIELSRSGPGMAKVTGIEEFESNEPYYQDFVVKG